VSGTVGSGLCVTCASFIGTSYGNSAPGGLQLAAEESQHGGGDLPIVPGETA
jgi:hypothetical protein